MRIEKKENDTKSEYIVWNETKTHVIAGATIKDSTQPIMLKRIDVRRNRRSDGVGTKLLREIISDFEDSEIAAEIFSSRLDWYKRHGFEIEKELEKLVRVRREPQ